jgi:hypothetical protein
VPVNASSRTSSGYGSGAYIQVNSFIFPKGAIYAKRNWQGTQW